MNATSLLERQHRKVEALFKKLESGRSDPAPVLEELANSLAAHMAIEQDIFYPAIREVDSDMVNESYEEHSLAEVALKRLLATDPEDEAFPGLLILRPEGRIFFLNAARIGERAQRLVDEYRARVVVIDLSGVFDLEYSALVALVEAEKRLRENGITVWLAGLTPGVLEVVQRSELAKTLGRERMHFNLEIAVREYLRSVEGQESDKTGAGRLAQGSARAPGGGA